MASNEFYDSSGAPSTGSGGSSATMRAEFDAIEAGMLKLPTLASNGDKHIAVNAGGTALEAKTAAESRTLLDVYSQAEVAAADAVVAATVTTNATNIATNVTNIATNTADIATNASNTATLEHKPNLLINGGFQIWQRSTSVSGNGYVSADMWFIGESAAAVSCKSARGFDDSINTYMNLKAESTGQANLGIRQGIELQDSGSASQLKGKTFTLSFKVYPGESGLTGLTQVQFLDEIGSADHAVEVSALDVTHTLTSGAWTTVTKTFTISVDEDSRNNALEVFVGVYKSGGVAADTDSKIADVKLEESGAATAFVAPILGDELARCQRYFQQRSTSGVDDYDLRPPMWKAATETGSGSPYSYTASL